MRITLAKTPLRQKKEFTTISLPNGMDKAEMKIYAMSGRMVKSKTVNNGERISLQGLQADIYNVLIVDKQNRYTERLMIQ